MILTLVADSDPLRPGPRGRLALINLDSGDPGTFGLTDDARPGPSEFPLSWSFLIMV
jgi:hypothetical protein